MYITFNALEDPFVVSLYAMFIKKKEKGKEIQFVKELNTSCLAFTKGF